MKNRSIKKIIQELEEKRNVKMKEFWKDIGNNARDHNKYWESILRSV